MRGRGSIRVDPRLCAPVFDRAAAGWSTVAQVPRYSSEAADIACGDLLKQRNYNQARRQKEESRKARQQKKLQRRSDRTTPPGDSGGTEGSPAEPIQPIEPPDVRS